MVKKLYNQIQIDSKKPEYNTGFVVGFGYASVLILGWGILVLFISS